MPSDTRLNPDYLVQNEAELRGFFTQTHQIAPDPCLDAKQFVALGTGFIAGALRMGHAPARGHPIHLSGIDHLVGADAVAVFKFAIIPIGHRPKPDMRMGAHVNATFVDELSRSHLIEKDKWPQHLAVGRRQRAPHLKPANIARTGNDQRLDAIAIRLRAFGVLDRVPTHHITPFSSV